MRRADQSLGDLKGAHMQAMSVSEPYGGSKSMVVRSHRTVPPKLFVQILFEQPSGRKVRGLDSKSVWVRFATNNSEEAYKRW